MRIGLLGISTVAALFACAAPAHAAQTSGAQVLYAYDDGRHLSTIDLTTPTPTATLIGTLPFAIGGLAAQPGTGRLFGVRSSDNMMFEIDPATAAVTQIGPLGPNVGSTVVRALEFTRDGRLIGNSWEYQFSTPLFQVDVTTGHATLLGFPDDPSAGGLAQAGDGNVYATVRSDPSHYYLEAYDPTTWSVVSTVPIASQQIYSSLEADCDGTLYAIGGVWLRTLYRVLLPGSSVQTVGEIAGINHFITALAFAIPASSLPQTYCTAKVNSLGCLPSIGSSGAPSATATSGFVVVGANVRNNKVGLLFYSVSGQQSVPYQGGMLCVKWVIKRTPAVSSGGNPLPANDCSGVYQVDMNSFAQTLLGGNPMAALQVPGTGVDCQWWGRDPGFAAPNNTTLSNGLRYFVCQ